ncbi:MAG: LysM peptidoglycan-binding domain-containing protein [Chloroflexi bacterium]|nr:LysM peptidoglycan-binding domain-containing protein [Chloroflexota bacterium]
MRKVASLILALTLVISILMTVAVDQVQAAESSYTVQSGDTLTGIAARFGLTVTALAEANGISNVNNIYAGQVLKVPGASVSNSNNSTPAPTTGEIGYLVQPGDTLSGIAARFNVSITQLAARNQISAMSYVYAGQTLRIPGTGAAASTPAPTATPAPAAPKPAASGSTYTVQHGDSLSAIASRFGVTVDGLVAANSLSSASLIFAGQVLNIPAGGQGGAPAQQPAAAPATNPASSGKWIDVNLSQQRMVAYEGSKQVFSSLVSTGVSNHLTVTGTFNIYVKYQSQAMTGGSGAEYYYLPGVPYVMYFYSSYALHGTYWHNNFGHPMSHGCVNLPTPAAQWVYNWAPVGTPVKVHY